VYPWKRKKKLNFHTTSIRSRFTKHHSFLSRFLRFLKIPWRKQPKLFAWSAHRTGRPYFEIVISLPWFTGTQVPESGTKSIIQSRLSASRRWAALGPSSRRHGRPTRVRSRNERRDSHRKSLTSVLCVRTAIAVILVIWKSRNDAPMTVTPPDLTDRGE